MSETPRVDSAQKQYLPRQVNPWELARQLERDLRECVELLVTSAEEMEESCQFEGRPTSMKVKAERIRALLSRLNAHTPKDEI